MRRILLVLALMLGLAIAYVDSRPTWDDTGVTVGTILLACAFLAFVEPERPWQWALLVGLWVPVLEVPLSGNAGSLLALAVALVGAYAGAAGRRLLAPPRTG